MKITLCIPTLNRYDLLSTLILSAEAGTLKPDLYFIVDNGGKLSSSHLPEIDNKLQIYKPKENLGVAGSWNYLIKHSEDFRIISNDDITFDKNTIEVMYSNFDATKLIYPSFASNQNIYSCFSISTDAYNTLGEFDESISPNYGYFEDNDYDLRLKTLLDTVGNRRVDYLAVPCGYTHYGSATLKAYSKQERDLHHKKFKIAQDNFQKKWGKLPHDI